MGELVNLLDWKQKKEDKEIEDLRAQIKEIVDSIGPPETGPMHYEESNNHLLSRIMTSVMLTALDGYRDWPIDSSDM
tara:strand:- start:597 stop:827 length:231 start_codon:yes stop_codon:yes gene_type:complete